MMFLVFIYCFLANIYINVLPVSAFMLFYRNEIEISAIILLQK